MKTSKLYNGAIIVRGNTWRVKKKDSEFYREVTQMYIFRVQERIQ